MTTPVHPETQNAAEGRVGRDPIAEGLNRDLSAPTVYHPDPEINAGIVSDAIAAEAFDVSIGYPPRSWRCPECSTAHSRGSFLTIGVHRCLSCGYNGTGGVMFGTSARMTS